MKLRSLSWAVLLLFVVGLMVSGCGLLSKEPPAVGSVTLTDRVDEHTMAAANSLTGFPQGTKLMYVSVLVQRPRKGTKVESRWYYDKAGDGGYGLVDASHVPFEEGGRDRHVAFSLEATTTFPTGAYKVEVYLDDQLAKEIAFRVE